jgi:multisubunit Na+/H+ antiporter MnhC subunit
LPTHLAHLHKHVLTHVVIEVALFRIALLVADRVEEQRLGAACVVAQRQVMIPPVASSVIQLVFIHSGASPIVPMTQLIIALCIAYLVVQLFTTTPGAFATLKVPTVCDFTRVAQSADTPNAETKRERNVHTQP